MNYLCVSLLFIVMTIYYEDYYKEENVIHIRWGSKDHWSPTLIAISDESINDKMIIIIFFGESIE